VTVIARSTSSGNFPSLVVGDLLSGRAFDNGCKCSAASRNGTIYNDIIGQSVSVECRCDAPRLRAQLDFVSSLMNIGKRLSQLPTKDLKCKTCFVHVFKALNDSHYYL